MHFYTNTEFMKSNGWSQQREGKIGRKKTQIPFPINLLASGPKLNGGWVWTDDATDPGLRPQADHPLHYLVSS